LRRPWGAYHASRKLIRQAIPHPPIKVVDREGFSASSTKLFKSPESALELGLGNGSGPCAFTIVRSGNRKLLEFGEETPPADIGHRRLLVGRETADEILRSIGSPDGMQRFDIMRSE